MKNFKAYLQLIRFDKPIGTLLLLWPILWALFIAAHGKPPFYAIVVFGLGAFLTRSAGCAINDYADADFDKLVHRTCGRPLARGVISKNSALILCGVLSITAFILALCCLKYQTVVLCIPAVLLFVLYPFTKRFFAYPQLILGLAYSFGILMAFIEIIGKVNLQAWILFAANLCWVFGYDTIYAMVDKVDDLKIGIKTSAISLKHRVVDGVGISYILFLLLLIVIGCLMQFGVFYWISLIVAASLLGLQVAVLARALEKSYFNMFLLNNWVGFVLFMGICLSLHPLR